MAHVYPILLDLANRKVVIIGGGRVAARKARGLIEAGANDVVVVSPQFQPDFPETVQKIAETYTPNHLEGAWLVFAATDRPEINAQIVLDAHQRRLLANRADTDESIPGDFVTPAKFQDQNVMLTVSASSAALAASIRDALQRRWDPKWTKMASAMQTLRPWIRAQSQLTQSHRAEVLRDLACEEAMNILDSGDIDSLRVWIKTKHPGLHDA